MYGTYIVIKLKKGGGYEYVKQKIDKKCTSLYIFYRRVLSCAQIIANLTPLPSMAEYKSRGYSYE